MIKKVSIILCIISFWVSLVVAQQQEKPKVDYRSDLINLIGDELIKFTGNVVFHHNGAIITCDTAYKRDKEFEGIGNVVINTDSTYIYGDKFTYDEGTSIAKVYAPIIKTVDKDAILYTRNMEFNTLTNIGSYYGGGTLTQKDNLMESERGDYNTTTRNMILTGLVEMQNDDMTLSTDSVGFNLNTEYITFFTKTSIWSAKGEYLESYKGSYDSAKELYTFTDSAYILTKDQEVWADSVRHWSGLSESELNYNIQIIDTTQKMMAFGDYGHYWSKQKKIIMTHDPVVLSYNPDNILDSVFTRADTLLIFPQLSPVKEISTSLSTLDSIGLGKNFDKLQFEDSMVVDSVVVDTTKDVDAILESTKDVESESALVDDIDTFNDNSISSDSTSVEQKKEEIVEVKLTERQKKQQQKREKKQQKKEEKRKKKEQRREAQLEKRREGRFSSWLKAPESDSLMIDSTELKIPIDSLKQDSTFTEIEYVVPPDSSDYIIRGLDSAMIYKNDMQVVCDTIISITYDSTMYMNKNVVIWNLDNQITAEQVVLFFANEQADRAELYDFPIIAQFVETAKYNQIRGKFMEVFFKNNELDITYVDGNAETVFYQEEEEEGKEEVVGVITATSSSMEISFDSSLVSRVKMISDYKYKVTPLEKITPNDKLELEGFKWHEDNKPTRKDMYNKSIKKSVRLKMEAIKRPKFNITEVINSEKKQLLEEGLWRDRNELISPAFRQEIIFRD